MAVSAELGGFGAGALGCEGLGLGFGVGLGAGFGAAVRGVALVVVRFAAGVALRVALRAALVGVVGVDVVAGVVDDEELLVELGACACAATGASARPQPAPSATAQAVTTIAARRDGWRGSGWRGIGGYLRRGPDRASLADRRHPHAEANTAAQTSVLGTRTKSCSISCEGENPEEWRHVPSPLHTHPSQAAPATRRARRARFRGDIEGLRAVAVLTVVAFHAGVGFLRGGFVGVDVFFVLSGFLITGLLLDELARTGRISLTNFYARRVRRLLPLSTLVLAATAAASWLLVPAIDRKGIASDLVASALWSANWRFAAESAQYMADTDKSPVLHFWSLGVEEQFYVVGPLLIIAVAGLTGIALRSWKVVFRRVALDLGVILLGSLFLSWQQTSSGSAGAYYGLHTRAWELAAGGLLALVRPVLPLLTRRAAVAAAWVGAALVVGSALTFDSATPFPGIAAVVPVLGTVLLVAGGARAEDRGISALLSLPLPRFIGRISYSWYLWHWPVLVIANSRWPSDDVVATGASPHAAPAVVAAAVLVSFVLAVASHYAVEQPLRTASFLAKSRRRSLQWGGVLVTTSLVAACGLGVGSMGSERPVVEAATAAGPLTPEQARESKPDSSGCYTDYATTSVPPLDDCRVGPESGASMTIALVGDSHAQQWLPALEEAAKHEDWTVYHFAKPTCTMTDVPIWHVQTKGRYKACEQWRANVLERLKEAPELDAVVVGRWKDYKDIALQPNGDKATPATIGKLWAEGSRRTYSVLADVAPRVVVMADTPRPTQDVPACLSAKDPDECAFDSARTTHQDGVLFKAEKAAAPKVVRSVDLTGLLCPDPTCPVVSPKGQIMYRDANHLTDGYSKTLWRQVAKALDKAVA
jgi:peptidoglycan/LPS O-acetylase OafA/YrhL